ncbi:2',3'-cyclic-nucleotide 3'-phosphodiesterase [Obelidium mucronatum]|nr:2',3'-cyclic-nucleotide 3'-phosphodiesterase [Obelidium mucronatum]
MANSIPGLSLWIGPPKGSVLDRKLNDIVSHFSSKLGTPKWGPHITLLGSVVATAEQATLKIQQAVQGRGSFKVPLVDLVTKDFYFQCVMAKAEETAELMSLNALLRTVYPPPHSEPYWPHLSLVYGDLDAKTKDQIVEEIKSNKEWSDIVGSVVEVSEIQLWNTEGAVDNWKLVGTVSLQ